MAPAQESLGGFMGETGVMLMLYLIFQTFTSLTQTVFAAEKLNHRFIGWAKPSEWCEATSLPSTLRRISSPSNASVRSCHSLSAFHGTVFSLVWSSASKSAGSFLSAPNRASVGCGCSPR